MLTTSALVSGRVLNNPNVVISFPHIEFIEQVVAMVTCARDSEDEEALIHVMNTVRMFVLGTPNSMGEPIPASEKVH